MDNIAFLLTSGAAIGLVKGVRTLKVKKPDVLLDPFHRCNPW
jgi:hypothetical protein